MEIVQARIAKGKRVSLDGKHFRFCAFLDLQAELAGSNVKVQPAGTATEGGDSTTVDSAIVMTAEECVKVSLKGLDMQEPTTLPSVNDLHLLATDEAAAGALMDAAQTSKSAERYNRVQ